MPLVLPPSLSWLTPAHSAWQQEAGVRQEAAGSGLLVHVARFAAGPLPAPARGYSVPTGLALLLYTEADQALFAYAALGLMK